MIIGRSVAGCIAVLLAATPASAKPTPEWREAFQSSPATYDAPSPAFVKAIAQFSKMAPERIAEAMKPQPLLGTVRYRVSVTAGGSKLRVRISNEEGEMPLRLASATVALAGDGFAARLGTMRQLAFGGTSTVTIPTGAPAISEAVELAVAPGVELLVSLSLASPLLNDARGGTTLALAPGDQANADVLRDVKLLPGRPAVTGVSVLNYPAASIVVAMGDSITDGNRSEIGALHGWPEQLSRRLAAGRKNRFTVVNAGIGGNRLLTAGWGDAGLARLDRDALRIEGISHLILLEGTNDIGMSGKGFFGDNPEVSAGELVSGYRQVIARAHDRGVKVILGTLTPVGGSQTHSSPTKDAIREAVNRWIRTAGEADGYIDFDKLTSDPAAPGTLRKDYDSGDHLHPSDAGYTAMANGIDLSMLR